MDRRKFLGSLAAIGCAGAAVELGDSSIVKVASAAVKKGKRASSENTVVFISDLHCNPDGYQPDYLRSVVKDILAMKPLPGNVIALGDLAYHTGKVREYQLLKPVLQPLADAGVKLTLAMGNHDRRENFAEVFPEYAATSLMADRLVFKVETPYADVIVLDSLHQGEDTEKWITEGQVIKDEKECLKKLLDQCTKPVFVCAHHPLSEIGITSILAGSRTCCGYIYGHNHRWTPGWFKKNYKSRRLIPSLCLPSTGHWGDIGYSVMTLSESSARVDLVQTDFFFPRPLSAGEEKPEVWKDIEEQHRDEYCMFPYKILD